MTTATTAGQAPAVRRAPFKVVPVWPWWPLALVAVGLALAVLSWDHRTDPGPPPSCDWIIGTVPENGDFTKIRFDAACTTLRNEWGEREITYNTTAPPLEIAAWLGIGTAGLGAVLAWGQWLGRRRLCLDEHGLRVRRGWWFVHTLPWQRVRDVEVGEDLFQRPVVMARRDDGSLAPLIRCGVLTAAQRWRLRQGLSQYVGEQELRYEDADIAAGPTPGVVDEGARVVIRGQGHQAEQLIVATVGGFGIGLCTLAARPVAWIPLAVTAASALLLLWLARRPRVIVSPEGLEVRNVVRVHRFSWADVRHLEADVRLAEGWNPPAFAGQQRLVPMLIVRPWNGTPVRTRAVRSRTAARAEAIGAALQRWAPMAVDVDLQPGKWVR